MDLAIVAVPVLEGLRRCVQAIGSVAHFDAAPLAKLDRRKVDLRWSVAGWIVPELERESAGAPVELHPQRGAGHGARVGADGGFERPAAGIEIMRVRLLIPREE